MGKRGRFGSGCGFGVLLLACVGAQAQSESPAPAPAERPVEPPLRLEIAAAASSARVRHAAEVSATREPQRFTIVELPHDSRPGMRPRRTRHALSIKSEAPRAMLQTLGVSVSDCATRLRVPSSLRQSSGGIDVEIEAQIGLACRF